MGRIWILGNFFFSRNVSGFFIYFLFLFLFYFLFLFFNFFYIFLFLFFPIFLFYFFNFIYFLFLIFLLVLVCMSLHLEAKSKYVILPCTFAPNNESNFSITVFTENDVRVKPLKDPTELVVEVCLSSLPFPFSLSSFLEV